MQDLQRLSYRLKELSQASGLSLPFLRKEARDGKLRTRKVGGAVIVLAEDARRYLTGEIGQETDATKTA